MVNSTTESESGRNRKLLLGIGYWVQGLRCFPWMAINFFLKDGLRLESSTLQILQNSANLPMVAKPFYGIISDSIYIFGQHRVPYIALGAFLQAVSWIAIAISASSNISFSSITFYLLLGNLGASIAEVANDAIVAETSRHPSKNSSGELQSFVWMASSAGGILGNLICGAAINRFTPQTMFFVFAILLCFQFLVTLFVRESSLNLPKTESKVEIKKQIQQLLVALGRPEILYSIIWFSFSYAVIPALTGTMFYYQTQNLKIESSLLGLSKVFGQMAMLLWGAVYNSRLKSISSRKLILAVQVAMSVLMMSDFLFVKGVYREIGLPDALYVVVFSGLLEVLYFFKILPFSVLVAKLCPPGCEGSVMSFVMSAFALALIVSGYFGVALAAFVGVDGDDFSGLPLGILIQAACTLLPVFWVSFVPEDAEPKSKLKEN